MKPKFIFVTLLALASCIHSGEKKQIPEDGLAIQSGMLPYNWEALIKVPVPKWFEDAKFGIFIHWGPYSVPGWSDGKHYSEWYSTRMYREGAFRDYHLKTYGEDHGYKDFIPMFTAEKYVASEWAEILKASGAKYVIPTAEHHDGFAMWDTELTPWNAVDRGPGFDFIGSLGAAVRGEGLKYGISYHRERHWGFYTNSLNTYLKKVEILPAIRREIQQDPESELLYGPFGLTVKFMEDYKARFLELCRKYQPDFMWIDDSPANSYFPDAPAVHEFINTYHKEMITDYVNMAKDWNKEVYWNNKRWIRSNYPLGAGVDEKDYLQMDSIPDVKWQSSGGMAHSYGYDRTEDDAGKYKSVEILIETLIDAVSKNGNFLLDIGPKPDGTITQLQEQRLRGIGEWLGKYGECIYGTRPWSTFGYDNVRYTRKDGILYAILFEKPEGSMKLRFTKDLDEKDIKSIYCLNDGRTISWTKEEEGSLILDMPVSEVMDHAFVIKINISDK